MVEGLSVNVREALVSFNAAGLLISLSRFFSYSYAGSQAIVLRFTNLLR